MYKWWRHNPKPCLKAQHTGSSVSPPPFILLWNLQNEATFIFLSSAKRPAKPVTFQAPTHRHTSEAEKLKMVQLLLPLLSSRSVWRKRLPQHVASTCRQAHYSSENCITISWLDTKTHTSFQTFIWRKKKDASFVLFFSVMYSNSSNHLAFKYLGRSS